MSPAATRSTPAEPTAEAVVVVVEEAVRLVPPSHLLLLPLPFPFPPVSRELSLPRARTRPRARLPSSLVYTSDAADEG